MTDTVAVACLVAIPPTIVALAGLIQTVRNGKKTTEVHNLVNSRLDELLAATRLLSHAQGMADQRASQKEP